MTVEEATKEAAVKSVNEVAGQLENLFKIFQDVSKQDDSRKDKNMSTNVQDVSDITLQFQDFLNLIKHLKTF